MKEEQPSRKVAIFDIDGTIFRSSLLIEATEALVSEGIFPKEAKQSYSKACEDWLNRKKPYNEYLREVVKSYESHIGGIKEADFMRVANKVVAFRQQRVYCFSRDLIRDLKSKGYYLLAISGSPTELVREFCQGFGFDKVYGRVYEVGKNGIFTGKILYEEMISDKAKILERAMAKENLNLTDSVGVGDTEADIAFLSKVQNPICFNPCEKLYLHAKSVGWRVVVERKDVIYTI